MDRGNRSKRKSSKDEKRGSSFAFGTRDQATPEATEQYLFMIEFFIHHLTSDRLAKLNQMFFVPTTLSVEFLNFTDSDGIQITPVDPMFQPQAGVADDIEYFYSGRSVLFAIDQHTVVNKVLDLVIKLCVHKAMPEGVKPDVLVGQGELDLSKHFAALRKEMLQCWHKMAPPPKVFEGEVPLIYNEQEIGAVCIFVRISAFGQTIVTEFETPPERKVSSYVFKGNEGDRQSPVYKCRIVDSQIADVCRDSKDKLATEGPPCRVCVKEQHPCAPCGDPAGATLKPNVKSPVQPAAPELETGKRCSMIQSSRGPAQPCGKAVVLKVSGILNTGDDRKPTVTVGSELEATDPRSVDPDHDVFVLRIGKKGIVGAGEKSDIQLEMKTPKGPEKGPPLRYETREMQTDDKKKKGKKKKKC